MISILSPSYGTSATNMACHFGPCPIMAEFLVAAPINQDCQSGWQSLADPGAQRIQVHCSSTQSIMMIMRMMIIFITEDDHHPHHWIIIIIILITTTAPYLKFGACLADGKACTDSQIDS